MIEQSNIEDQKQIKLYLTQCLQVGHQGISLRVIYVIGFIVFSWTCVSILFLELNRNIFISPAEATLWMTAVYEKCENQTTLYTLDSPSVLQNICFSMSLYIWVMLSFVFGIKISKGIYLENSFRWHYKSLSIWQKTLRIFVLIILIGLLIPFFLIEFNSVYAQAFGCSSIYIRRINFNHCVLYKQQLCEVYQKLLYYLKISIPGDFLQIIDNEQSAPDGMSFELQAKSS